MNNMKIDNLSNETKPANSVNGGLADAPEMPKIQSIQVLAKFTDGKIRQLITSEDEGDWITSLLQQTSTNGRIKCIENPITNINWD